MPCNEITERTFKNNNEDEIIEVRLHIPSYIDRRSIRISYDANSYTIHDETEKADCMRMTRRSEARYVRYFTLQVLDPKAELKSNEIVLDKRCGKVDIIHSYNRQAQFYFYKRKGMKYVCLYKCLLPVPYNGTFGRGACTHHYDA